MLMFILMFICLVILIVFFSLYDPKFCSGWELVLSVITVFAYLVLASIIGAILGLSAFYIKMLLSYWIF